MFEVEKILFAFYLIVLSVMDIRKRKLSLKFLMSGLLLSVTACLTGSENTWIEILGGAAVGGVFIIISRITEESFGYGDSILILIMGCFLGFWNLIYVLMAAFSLAAVMSVFLLISRKFSRKSAFPFVPFLTAAYIGGVILGFL